MIPFLWSHGGGAQETFSWCNSSVSSTTINPGGEDGATVKKYDKMQHLCALAYQLDLSEVE